VFGKDLFWQKARLPGLSQFLPLFYSRRGGPFGAGFFWEWGATGVRGLFRESSSGLGPLGFFLKGEKFCAGKKRGVKYFEEGFAPKPLGERGVFKNSLRC